MTREDAKTLVSLVENNSSEISRFAKNWKYIVAFSKGDTILIHGVEESEPKFNAIYNDCYSIKNQSVEVKLNDKYTVIITKDKVKVGCQEFDASILDRLIAARQTLRII